MTAHVDPLRHWPLDLTSDVAFRECPFDFGADANYAGKLEVAVVIWLVLQQQADSEGLAWCDGGILSAKGEFERTMLRLGGTGLSRSSEKE